MIKHKLSCAGARNIDMVGYLKALGHHPMKIVRDDYWYLSPLRNEKNASFKINRKLNVWYDHGTGEGGDIIDFGTRFHHCDISTLLIKLQENSNHFSFHPQTKKEKISNQIIEGKIKIISTCDLTDAKLISYLHSRIIPLSIANKYCKEVEFELYEKKYKAIGFKNDAGGYELRNAFFKGSTFPKAVTCLNNEVSKNLFVFEGFFDFLSYQVLQIQNEKLNNSMPKQQQDFLVLNSLSFFEKSKMIMERYKQIHLYLDNDLGSQVMLEKVKQSQCEYVDHRKEYEQYKDLNDFLVNKNKIERRQSLRLGKRL
jgi:hypothetical protein